MQVENRQARPEASQNVHSRQTDRPDETEHVWANLTQLLAELREREKTRDAKISELLEREKTQEAKILELREREKSQDAKISELRECHQILLKQRQEEQAEHIKSMDALRLDLRSQIEEMTQMIAQLHSRGLPQAPNDGYLQRSLDGIVHDIMQFARAFTRGQETLTWETLSACKAKLSNDMQDHLQGRFLDLKSLVSSQNVGAKVRTRCVQVIMSRRLGPAPLWDRPLGFPKEFKDMIKENSRNYMRCSGKQPIYPCAGITVTSN